MPRKPKEYEITYAVKLFLLGTGWDVIAYNPPGSQGTFTIPNPSKQVGYRGGSGSESPDIIAIKRDTVCIVECKPAFDASDEEKMNALAGNQDKMSILDMLIQHVCDANEISTSSPRTYLFCLAYSGTLHVVDELGCFIVKVDPKFDVTRLVGKGDYGEFFDTRFYPPNSWHEEIVGLFEN